MLTLGIDTSCDDTSMAVIDETRRIRSNIVSSQIDVHKVFGGIVPEIASRKHLELIDVIFRQTLETASIKAEDLDFICVTNGPGLVGSLLIGLCFAKGISVALKKPLIGVNHVEAHAMSVFLEQQPEFPFIALVVSGGHTIILLVTEPCVYTILGTTRDDAAGEAFDKIAKYLDLGYPGGRIIEETARSGRKDAIPFPRPMMDKNNYDFSFSGLKTAFINYAKNHTVKDSDLPDALASFQEAALDVLVSKTLAAADDYSIKRIVVGGGVACNARLRNIFAERAVNRNVEVMFSSPVFCTDNGAMVAVLGQFYRNKGIATGLDMNAYSRMNIKRQ